MGEKKGGKGSEGGRGGSQRRNIWYPEKNGSKLDQCSSSSSSTTAVQQIKKQSRRAEGSRRNIFQKNNWVVSKEGVLLNAAVTKANKKEGEVPHKSQ